MVLSDEEFQEKRKRGPGAPMEPYLGEQIPSEVLREGRGKFGRNRVIAYKIRALEGRIITIESPEDVRPALRELFLRELPNIDCPIDHFSTGPFWKYAILHGVMAAPPHQHTGEAMSIEIYARTVRVANFDFHANRIETHRLWRTWANRTVGLPSDTASDVGSDAPLVTPGLITMEIASATYSNFGRLGYGVPYYF